MAPNVADVANAIENEHPFEEPSFMRVLDLEAMHALEFLEYMNAYWKENNYINQNLLLETSCNNINNIDNNYHHHHQQPKLENFLGGHSFADHHHDYGANSSGDYLFQNCSQPEVTAGGGEGSAGGTVVVAKNLVVADGEFAVGMEFSSREAVIREIKDYTIQRGVDYRSNHFSRSFEAGEAIKPLVEADPSIKVKSVIVEVQSKFNYTVSYRKAWLAKQKSVEKIFGGWEASYEALPIWFEAMCHKEPSEIVDFETMPAYQGDDLVTDIRVLHRVFWSYYPYIRAFRHCKSVVQVDETHLYEKYKSCLLVAVSQDGNNNIVPIAFAIVEGETTDA
ncbi:uncharacterized protein LOC107487546 [Arachis duranensis]|uniref:Uncharacterized protein LOC107487546 n=1 Tax=Arachis duranensis TaxID=130453 RepID=A0A6P4D7P4_ARADU|nr:uncharacterized protein LOC107487546 [Arachis duranensis]